MLIFASTQSVVGTNAGDVSGINWSQLLGLHVEDGALKLTIGPLCIIALAVGVAAYLFWRFKLRTPGLSHYEVVEATLKVANIGEIKLKPNSENIRIAYQAWVELSTRKVALPFDEEHDVVVEVYNSCYEVFGRLRELAKSIPAQRLRECEDTRTLVDVMVKVLNEGLRPHLTIWQSKFRRWYQAELDHPDCKALTPQQIQKRYPDYKVLVADLRKLSDEVREYAEFLLRVTQGKK